MGRLITVSLLATAATLSFACTEAGRDKAAPTLARECRLPSNRPIRVAGGSFMMGQADVYPEEGPVREVTVGSFWIDPHEVTNDQFARFVQATGYVTIAERPVDPSQFAVPAKDIPPDLLQPGSAVFIAPNHPSERYADWWRYVPGASWRKPHGPSGPDSVPNEPVVHLGYADMLAYARWRGGRLPTEAEWEFAAGDEHPVADEQPVEANSWQGAFPTYNKEQDGFAGIAPVGCYKPNAKGLYDMIGNVWEMTSDHFRPGHDPLDRINPKGPNENAAYDPQNLGLPSRVIKGGSYLCAPNYCRRYRPAARSGRDVGLGASNVGFRLAYDHPSPDRAVGRLSGNAVD